MKTNFNKEEIKQGIEVSEYLNKKAQTINGMSSLTSKIRLNFSASLEQVYIYSTWLPNSAYCSTNTVRLRVIKNKSITLIYGKKIYTDRWVVQSDVFSDIVLNTQKYVYRHKVLDKIASGVLRLDREEEIFKRKQEQEKAKIKKEAALKAKEKNKIQKLALEVKKLTKDEKEKLKKLLI